MIIISIPSLVLPTYSYLFANRLGANSLVACVFGGMYAAGKILDYCSSLDRGCDEVDEGKAWSGVIEVHLALCRAEDGEEILRRTYARRIPAAARNPTAVVEAIRQGLDEIAAQLVKDLRPALAAEREGDG